MRKALTLGTSLNVVSHFEKSTTDLADRGLCFGRLSGRTRAGMA
jgi:hypothetical protein